MKKTISTILTIVCIGLFLFHTYGPKPSYSTLTDVPEYSGEPYVIINDNKPTFTEKELKASPYEDYTELDYLNRPLRATAMINKSLMPTEERGTIGSIKPPGWHTVKYDVVPGKYLYNRCHLIGHQLTGENANKNNLVTCTRYMNTEGMLPFENMVTDYIKETNNKVLYRITPIYKDNNLLIDGVQLEAQSIEDNSIEINIFIYNIQPGVVIDYETGKSSLE